MKTFLISWMAGIFGMLSSGAAELQVSALHPLMADLAREVGGERVKVYDLVGEGGNPHRYEPRPADLQQMQASALVLAGGKNLEPYLDRLKSSLTGVSIIEVGKTIPSLEVHDHFCESHGHSHGASTVDPHWWHGIENMRRASRIVAQALSEKDPEGKAHYESQASAYGKRLDELKKWAQTELAKIPTDQRKLVTAHNAFGYFAKEFDLEVIAVAGLNKEQNTAPKEQAETIKAVKDSAVRVIFPELGSSIKPLEAIAVATGTRLGTPLIADGNGRGNDAGFEPMIRHNVNAITQALAAP